MDEYSSHNIDFTTKIAYPRGIYRSNHNKAKIRLEVWKPTSISPVFDERDIREGLGGGHGVMIAPRQIIFPQDFSLNRFTFVFGI